MKIETLAIGPGRGRDAVKCDKLEKREALINPKENL